PPWRRFLVRLVFLSGRDGVAAAKPAVQVHIGAALGAEWLVLFSLRFAADDAFALVDGLFAHSALASMRSRGPGAEPSVQRMPTRLESSVRQSISAESSQAFTSGDTVQAIWRPV